MADDVSIQSIKISVSADTSSAIGSLEKLTAALAKLSASTQKGFGGVVESLTGLTNAVGKIASADADKFSENMKKIAQALETVSSAKIDTAKVNAAVKASNVRIRAAELEAKKAKEAAEIKVKADKIEASRERAKILAENAKTAAAKEARLRDAAAEKAMQSGTTARPGGKDNGDAFDSKHSGGTANWADVLKSRADTIETWKNRVSSAINAANKAFSAFIKTVGRTSVAIAKMAVNVGIAPFKKLGASVSDVVKKFSGFLSALKRIAVYRAIRFVLKEITQAFREGIENLYQYSKIINGTFAASMDTLSTSALYAKNSLAAMAAPLVNTLAPAVDFVIDKFVDLLNTINEVVASMTGAETWTKAIKYPTEYAEAADGATGSAKKLRATLLGFDEINRLDDNSKGKRGSAGEEIDYSKMFEEKTVSKKAKSIVSAIKEAFASGDLKNLGKNLGKKISQGLNSIDWNSIKSRFEQNATMVGSFINGLIDTPSLGTDLGRTIANVFNTAVGKMRTFFTTVNWKKVGTFLGDGINSIVNTFDFAGLARTQASIINSAVDLLHNFIQTVDWFKFGSFLADGINNYFDELNTAHLAETISDALLGAISMVWQFLHDTDFQQIGEKIADFFKHIKWGELLSGLAAILAGALKDALDLALGIIKKDPLFATALAAGVAYKISVALGGATISETISQKLGSVLGSAANATTTSLKTSAASVAGGIASGIALTGLALAAVGWLADKITDGESTRLLEKAFNVSLTNSAIGAHEMMISGSALSKAASYAKSQSGSSVPYSSPYYASGGYPEAGSLFIAGERGAEIVSYSGGRTQVSNRDQLSTAVANGMEFANEEQNALLREQNSLLRQLANKEFTSVTQITTGQIASALNRANIRNGSTIVAIN